MQQHVGVSQLNGQELLFLSLTEQLTHPLLQIRELAELAAQTDTTVTSQYWQTVQAIAGTSLELAENYALSLRVHGKLRPLEIEPVALSSMLYDTAQALTPYARQYGIELELESAPRMQPVLADRTVLMAAMTSLGQVFVTAGAEAEGESRVRLSAYRSRYGLVAGLYGSHEHLGVDSLRRAYGLVGKARQPLQRLTSGPATGVFVADSLLQTLSAHLHVARYHKLTGLAATLAPSQQLQLM